MPASCRQAREELLASTSRYDDVKKYLGSSGCRPR
jgi:hypothetical protein